MLAKTGLLLRRIKQSSSSQTQHQHHHRHDALQLSSAHLFLRFLSASHTLATDLKPHCIRLFFFLTLSARHSPGAAAGDSMCATAQCFYWPGPGRRANARLHRGAVFPHRAAAIVQASWLWSNILAFLLSRVGNGVHPGSFASRVVGRWRLLFPVFFPHVKPPLQDLSID